MRLNMFSIKLLAIGVISPERMKSCSVVVTTRPTSGSGGQ